MISGAQLCRTLANHTIIISVHHCAMSEAQSDTGSWSVNGDVTVEWSLLFEGL